MTTLTPTPSHDRTAVLVLVAERMAAGRTLAEACAEVRKAVGKVEGERR